MEYFRSINKRKMFVIFLLFIFSFVCLSVRLIYIMIGRSGHYSEKAVMVQEREREIKAARGKILDRNHKVLGANKTVCTISVIHNQITDKDRVVDILSETLSLDKEEVKKKVYKKSSREKIKSNVDKETGDKIRAYDLDGVKVDEDYKRYYPNGSLASKVLGFTGADNQGIIGLEIQYDKYLTGTPGKILTVTDAKGVELDNTVEKRLEPVDGLNLVTTIDINIQSYAMQMAEKVLEQKKANYVSIIVMNPQNGEIYAMVNAPEFDLNNPYELVINPYSNKNTEEDTATADKNTDRQDMLNRMWRNQSINDTYEPGSTFKMITATAGLSEKIVTTDSLFHCPGYYIVDDRKIRCHKTSGHGAENFVEGTMNSCNPVFINVGLKVGKDNFYKYLRKLGILEKSGVDLPGEAGTIIHKLEDVGNVELATMSFGQSFQITPLQLLRAASAIINGGNLVTPHFAIAIEDNEGKTIKTFSYETARQVIDREVSDTMRYILGKVVSEGGGKKGAVEGYDVGGKTATSEKLPRGNGKYIGSFIGFCPVENPQIIAICIVDEPEGIYYGGTIAAPVIKELYENILPYLDIEKSKTNSLIKQ